MHIDSTDNKFGLPKPDFQRLPKKKAIWPVLMMIVGIILLLIATKMGYNFYFRMAKNSISAPKTTNNSTTADQVKDAGNDCSATHSEKVGANGTLHPCTDDSKTFEHKKSNNIRKSITATQKQLAAKQKKPLIKPGTFQELKEPQGIYHLVVVSHLEKQSAMKVVQQLMKKNLGVCLILPRAHKGEKYYRVTIGHSKTRYEADNRLEQFKSTYNNIFILKY